MLTKILPEFFNRIKLWRIWRQRYNRNVFGQLHFLGCVETCLIPDHKHMHSRISFLFKLSEKCIHRICIEIRGQQSSRLSSLWTGGAENIKIFVLCLPPRRRPCPFNCPLPGQSSLLTKTSFILKPEFHFYSRITSTELPDLITDFFLKASLFSGSPLGCSGLEDT